MKLVKQNKKPLVETEKNPPNVVGKPIPGNLRIRLRPAGAPTLEIQPGGNKPNLQVRPDDAFPAHLMHDEAWDQVDSSTLDPQDGLSGLGPEPPPMRQRPGVYRPKHTRTKSYKTQKIPKINETRKLTKRTLQRIVEEEIKAVLKENDADYQDGQREAALRDAADLVGIKGIIRDAIITLEQSADWRDQGPWPTISIGSMGIAEYIIGIFNEGELGLDYPTFESKEPFIEAIFLSLENLWDGKAVDAGDKDKLASDLARDQRSGVEFRKRMPTKKAFENLKKKVEKELLELS